MLSVMLRRCVLVRQRCLILMAISGVMTYERPVPYRVIIVIGIWMNDVGPLHDSQTRTGAASDLSEALLPVGN